MKAAEVLDAIVRAHRDAAIVCEVVLDDPEWLDDFAPGRSRPQRRIDALMFKSLERTAIEVKVTKADFERDHWEKRRPWVRITHRFVYAVPAGLIDVPPYGCGLWWVHEDGKVTVKRKATITRVPEPLPQQIVQALAYRVSRKVSSESNASGLINLELAGLESPAPASPVNPESETNHG